MSDSATPGNSTGADGQSGSPRERWRKGGGRRFSDRIELRGLRVIATHGVLPHEKTTAQPFELDMDLLVDTREAARTDDLTDTADYGWVVETAVDVVTRKPHQLLESLAVEIADELLADVHILAATVTVRKLRPPLAFDIASSAVRVTRRRPHPESETDTV